MMPGSPADAGDALNVDVVVAPEARDVPPETSITTWVRHAVAGSGCAPKGPAEVCIRIVGDAEIRDLNTRYRGKATATNVLSFPADDAMLPPGLPRPLGDIVICGAVVAREAREQGKAAQDHWAHLVTHGALHLLGFDHEEPAAAARMEALEAGLLGKLGISDPYAG